MMPSPLAHDRSDHASEHAVDILILSLDDALIADVERSLDGAYHVHHARSASLAIDMLAEHRAGVLITDEAVEHPAFHKLARQLRQQFPSLIIIGVGEREAAASLIDLVNSGEVYRFLLKPLSAGQVRLRVQSAARQHLTLRDGTVTEVSDDDATVDRRVRPERPPPYEIEPGQVAAAGGRRLRRPLMLGGAVAGVVAVILSAVVLMNGGEKAAQPAQDRAAAQVAAPAPVTAPDAEPLSDVERALDAASAALQEGRYIEPVEDNALDHYLSVLELEPYHPEAAAGLDTIAGVLLERAQTALSENNPADALAARTVVQGIRPDHPDMPLVDAQFAEHGRLLISRMNLAVAADDWARAREELDLAAQFLPQDSPDLADARTLLDQRRSQFAINDRLGLVNARIESNKLTVPENDSAAFHLLALRDDYPENEAVLGGLENLAGIMLERVDSFLGSADFETAERWLGEVERLGVQAEALAGRRESLASAQSATEATIGPEAVVTQTEEGASAAAGAEAADAAGGELAGAAEASPDAAGAEGLVASTAPIGTGGGAGARIDASPVEVSELKILRMVQPEYPRRAYVRDIDGWIDVEFTVTETGLTRAIEVTGAKTRGWFDRAAIEAVEQWQFQPELQNGQAVERRAKVRLQFTRDE